MHLFILLIYLWIDMNVLAKTNVQAWAKLAAEELRVQEHLEESQVEQVRWTFLVIEAFPNMRNQLMDNPKLVLSKDFQQKIQRFTSPPSSVEMEIRVRNALHKKQGNPEISLHPQTTLMGEKRDSLPALPRIGSSGVVIAADEQPKAYRPSKQEKKLIDLMSNNNSIHAVHVKKNKESDKNEQEDSEKFCRLETETEGDK
ncbi:hypothetical protein RFI_18619, partial [Reticulomyxa filosa]